LNVFVGQACLPLKIAIAVVGLSIGATDWVVVVVVVVTNRVADTRRLILFIQGANSTVCTRYVITSQAFLAFSSVGQSNFPVRRASLLLQLAFVAVRATVASTDRIWTIQAFLDADTRWSIPLIDSTSFVWCTRYLIANGGFDAFAIVEPEDTVVAETCLPSKLTVVDVRFVVAATDGRSVAIAFFVTDTSRLTIRTHNAMSVR